MDKFALQRYGVLLLYSLCLSLGWGRVNAQTLPDEVHDLMRKQALAWNLGKLDEFMSYYWQSDSLQFVTSKGMMQGWENLRGYYWRSYAKDSAMGQLQFDLIDGKMLSNDQALLTGRWRVKKNQENKEGYFTLLLRRIHGQWKIVYDHTS